MRPARKWPVLTSYSGAHLAQVAMPLGGIGTGTVSIGGRGNLQDWEVMNRPAKGFTPPGCFFALHARSAGKSSVTRALEGALLPPFEGSSGSVIPNHGLPRFRDCRFDAAYPLAQVSLSDPDVPLRVRIEAFNPLIPGDADRSGIPVAALRFVLINPTARVVRASVCGSLMNFIGHDGSCGAAKRNRNAFRSHGRVQGIHMTTNGVDPASEQWGSMALATTARGGVSYTRDWPGANESDKLLEFWDEFSADGQLTNRRPGAGDSPRASLAVSLGVPARSARSVTFLVTWHFPNRMTWTPHECSAEPRRSRTRRDRVGNYYATCYRDAWDVAARSAAALPRLEADTLSFVTSFVDSDLPAAVKESALYNISTLRTQTAFRIKDGTLLGWEGTHAHEGCCFGSCTHVWNYETTTAFLFADLARSMREVEFLHATRDSGHMTFRTTLPLKRANKEHFMAAADGQMGCLMKLYREWQLSGDDTWLRRIWPMARKALAFCWIPGGWDADKDGVMEGTQHNTMDVNYFGPNPQMGSWYLGALRACEEIARHQGDNEFAETCRDLFESGSRWLDAHLFNGEYYEHEIRPLRKGQSSAPGLHLNVFDPNAMKKAAAPPNQLGSGCLIDQLVGQYMAHVCGLGYLLKKRHVRTTLRSILKHNFKRSFYGHFNNRRSYVLSDESAVLMSTYPLGRRPKSPFPYFTEVMTGFEHQLASHMIYEGQTASAMKVIKAIRARYDGRRRNPFNEAECGNHYARAMAAWSHVLALTGFHYSAVTGAMSFAAREGTHFWANGSAWGTCRIRKTSAGYSARLNVLYGRVSLKQFGLSGAGTSTLPRARALNRGSTLSVRIRRS